MGRNDLIDIFRKNLREQWKAVESTDGKPQPRVLNIWGVSGIGKTELVRQLRGAAEEEFHASVFAGVEFQPGGVTEVDIALRAIRREARDKYHVDFPTFDIAYAIYWKVARPDFTPEKSQFPLWDEVGLGTDLLKAVADAPLFDWLPKIARTAAKTKQAAQNWWTKRGQPLLTGLPFEKREEILKLLPLFLAADLDAHRISAEVKTPLVIYLDAYESLWGENRKPSNILYEDGWVRDLINALPSALFLISGQQPLRWPDKWPEWTELTESHELTELTEARVEDFLTGSGVKEPEIRKRISEGSHGVPFYLDLSVNTYDRLTSDGQTAAPDQFGGTFDEIFTRFLRNLKEYEQLGLKVLSAARSWDRPLAETMLSEFCSPFPLAEFDEFLRFSFVKHVPSTNRFALHDLMRTHLTDEPDFKQFHHDTMHPWLLLHYDAVLEGMDIKDVSEQHRLAFVEGFYHASKIRTVKGLYEWTTDTADPFNQAAEWSLLVPAYSTLIILLEGEGEDAVERMATSLNNLAYLFHNQGELDQAELLYKQAIKITRTALGENHSTIASSLNNLAGLYWSQRRFEQAEPLFKRAMEIQRNTFGETHPDFAISINNLAQLYAQQADFDQAEPLLKQAMAILQETEGATHPNFATSLNNLAQLYMGKGEFGQAEALYKQAMEDRRMTLGDNHPDFATSLNDLAVLYCDQGEFDQAEPLLNQAIEIRREALGGTHPRFATSLNNLASFYDSQGKFDQAVPLVKQAMSILRSALGETHPDFAGCLNNLANIFRRQGRFEQAESLFKKALETRRGALGETHPDFAGSLNSLACVYHERGKFGQAEPLYRHALEIFRQTLGETHPDFATNLNNLAGLYCDQGKLDQAEPLYRRAMEIRRTALGENHPAFATSLNNLAGLHYHQGRLDQAEPLYKQATRILVQVYGPIHPNIAAAHGNLAALYDETGQQAKAAEHAAKAREIREELARRAGPAQSQ